MTKHGPRLRIPEAAQEVAPWSATESALAAALREQLEEYHAAWEVLGGRAPPASPSTPATPDGHTCRDFHTECLQWAAQARTSFPSRC